jgi:hypothetical protein
MVTQVITKLAEVRTDIMEQIALGVDEGLAEVGKKGFSHGKSKKINVGLDPFEEEGDGAVTS